MGSFTIDTAKYVLTTEFMKQITKADFYIEDCIHELSISSLLEITSFSGNNEYHFHVIVRNFLESNI